ncbi:hypothetical protein LF1_59440 [Rubripirellula obstinata]|uniref:Uncharacterized protein n=1 Tax=Rubripirellula obstinata TaxID=406547 RepID=A0A5B1C6R0_9BACT|nr:hypothetical protein LF1_59440 [Rubripirellula obstinata]
MPRRAVGTWMLVERWGQGSVGRALDVPRRARGGQQVSGLSRITVRITGRRRKDLQANEKADHRRSGACDGYPQSCCQEQVQRLAIAIVPEQIPIIFEADQAVRKRAVQDFDTVVGNCSVIDGENLELWKIRDRVNRRV